MALRDGIRVGRGPQEEPEVLGAGWQFGFLISLFLFAGAFIINVFKFAFNVMVWIFFLFIEV